MFDLLVFNRKRQRCDAVSSSPHSKLSLHLTIRNRRAGLSGRSPKQTCVSGVVFGTAWSFSMCFSLKMLFWFLGLFFFKTDVQPSNSDLWPLRKLLALLLKLFQLWPSDLRWVASYWTIPSTDFLFTVVSCDHPASFLFGCISVNSNRCLFRCLPALKTEN